MIYAIYLFNYAIYYFIFIESDPTSVFGVPPISKERPKKPSFGTGNKKMG